LLIEPDWIQINPEAALWIDVAVFEHSFDRVRGAQGRELGTQDTQALRSAVDLYRGGLQESWYQDWYLYDRERFQHMYVVMLDKLMDHCEAYGDYETGLTYGTLILRGERSREHTHRRLMRLHCLAGDRTAALRQYERCVRALDEELGVKPAKQTTLLYQQIRTDQFDALEKRPNEADQAVTPAPSTLYQVVECLRGLQSVLNHVQHHVEQGIRAAERTLGGQS
jgi:DNA-binding SARP family transcriptional activator